MSDNSTFLYYLPYDSNRVDQFIGNAFNITRAVVLLPLSVYILYLAHRRWRQQRSFKAVSHSEIFTYHSAVLEIICNLGILAYVYGIYCAVQNLYIVGFGFCSFAMSGETSFHLLTCVDRYLAVVHPITYMGLRNERGLRIRNISIACAWLLSFMWSCIATLDYPDLPFIPLVCLLVFSLVVASFCSFTALCVLIRPGPGEGGRDRQRVDQSKQRAFLTIMAITGVLWFWFLGFLCSFALVKSQLLSLSVGLIVAASSYWCMMPSSLLIPLLYLCRKG